MSGKSPEVTFRIGNCSASVWANEVNGDKGKRQLRSVSVQRSYQDGDERKYISSFGLNDLPAAIRVLELAQQHVEREEAQVTGKEDVR
jgi:hypothetical protein